MATFLPDRVRDLLLLVLVAAPWHGDAPQRSPSATHRLPLDSVVANDNRRPAGTMRNGVLDVRLVAVLAGWRPTPTVDSMVTVQAFAEEGSAPRIPGPLIRAPQGTLVRLSLRNTLPDSTLVVHGLRTGGFSNDTLQVAPGTTRRVSFRADVPGTYLYWGTTTGSPVADRPWRDSQLTGAIVVDPVGVVPDTAERLFVITILDLFPGDTVRNRAKDDVFDRAINGRAWPWTERLQYSVGDTVRWRWLNGSYLPHPMHLHGFHFRVTARGESNADTTYAPGGERTAVTEFMVAGSTFRMEWVPTRPGNWLVHCHMRPHVVPFPFRPDSVIAHTAHDLTNHPLTAMQGLVLGVSVGGRDTVAARPVPTRRLRLLAQQARDSGGDRVPRGFVLQRAADPRRDSIEVPGSPLVLVRGEATEITVVNRLRDPTTVHWHGMELHSVFDGVSGWSRTGGSIAPLLAPGDSFTVSLTPPRAGTFIYHTHMDEGPQLSTGMYGAMLVEEPGVRIDPAHDLTFLFGDAVVRDSVRLAINGASDPPPRTFEAGATYRLRFINIHSAGPAVVRLEADSSLLTWQPLAKDGADLPVAARRAGPSRLRRFGVGETYDFLWTPTHPMHARLTVEIEGTRRSQDFLVR